MASKTTTCRSLWCYILNTTDHAIRMTFDTESNPQGKPPYLQKVQDLYQFIIDESFSIRDLKPSSIKVWQLNADSQIEVDHPEVLAKKLSDIADLSTIARPLSNLSLKTSDVFAVAPPEDDLHIVVVFQEKSQRKISGPQISHLSSRSHVVATLYDMLEKFHVVQVRGTPCSGKTVLCILLRCYILERHNLKNTVEVLPVNIWLRHGLEHEWEDRLKRFGWSGWPVQGNLYYIIIDEAQGTYWDVTLWTEFIKTVQGQELGVRIILFCSHGSPSFREADHTHLAPLLIPPYARISLRPQTAGGIGLLLTRTEYEEVIAKHEKKILLEDDLRTAVYEWTAGHVGAVLLLINFIRERSAHQMRSGIPCTLESLGERSFDELTNFCQSSLRGLPKYQDIQQMGRVFRRMLKTGQLDVPETDTGADAALLEDCHTKGWIQSDGIMPNAAAAATRYSFPSPLHRAYVSWFLDPVNTTLPADYTLLQLVVEVIGHFQPSQLNGIRRYVGGELDDRPSEAQYQNELYRRLIEKFKGSVRITPEFASGTDARRAGRIDFFIPQTKWGIECTRDGIRLEEHASRFKASGAYGMWLDSHDMDDYILLDFRNIHPVKKHPDIPKLYHVVFDKEYTEVTIYNGSFEGRQKLNLTESSSRLAAFNQEQTEKITLVERK